MAPTLWNGFTNWDDPEYVTENPLVGDASPSTLWKVLVEPVVANHHPVTILSYTVDQAIFGEGPFGHHLTNLLLHAINAALVFVLVLRLAGPSPGVAAVVALLFGIHPMHVESVAWISGRKDVLYTLFFLASILVYLDFLRSRRPSRYALAFGLFVLAVFSKPAAVVLPVVLGLVDYLKGRRDLGRCLAEKAPFLVVSVLAGLLTVSAQSELAIRDVYTPAERIAIGSFAYLAYLVKLVAPVRLSAFYPYPEGEVLPAVYRFAPWVALAVTGGFLAVFRKNRLAVFGLLFFLVNIVLVLQFVTVGNAVLADRYTYVPYLGLFLLVALGARALAGGEGFRSSRRAAVVSSVLVVGMAVLGGIAFGRTFVWRDSESLWSDVIEKFPRRSREAYEGRGNHRLRAGRLERALPDFDAAVSLDPTRPSVYFNRGQAYVRLGDFDRAIADLSRAIELRPDDAEFVYQRGVARFEQGDDEGALADIDRCLEMDPAHARARLRRGLLLARADRLEEALADLTEGLRGAPIAEGYWNRSLVLARLGRLDEALRDARTAQRLGHPVDPAYLRRLGGR
jgi:Flp pilus assembly protein TadD